MKYVKPVSHILCCHSCYRQNHHDDVNKWKHFPRDWPFVRGIPRWSVNSPQIGQWRLALMFSLIYAWINTRVNHREAGGLRRYRDHYDVTVMTEWPRFIVKSVWILCWNLSFLDKNIFRVIIGAILIVQWSSKMKSVTAVTNVIQPCYFYHTCSNSSDTVTPITKNYHCHDNSMHFHVSAVTKRHYFYQSVTAVTKRKEDKPWKHSLSDTSLQNYELIFIWRICQSALI